MKKKRLWNFKFYPVYHRVPDENGQLNWLKYEKPVTFRDLYRVEIYTTRVPLIKGSLEVRFFFRGVGEEWGLNKFPQGHGVCGRNSRKLICSESIPSLPARDVRIIRPSTLGTLLGRWRSEYRIDGVLCSTPHKKGSDGYSSCVGRLGCTYVYAADLRICLSKILSRVGWGEETVKSLPLNILQLTNVIHDEIRGT